MGSNNQPRLREATMVITVQIIKLTNEPTFSRLRFVRYHRRAGCGLQSDAWADQRDDRRNNSHAPPTAVFAADRGTISARLTKWATSASRAKTGMSNVDSLSNKKRSSIASGERCSTVAYNKDAFMLYCGKILMICRDCGQPFHPRRDNV